jgi:hypothetical protein
MNHLLKRFLLTLLVSAVLLGAFTALVWGGLFDVVETRFYHPRILRGLNQKIEQEAQAIDTVLAELRDRFAATLEAGGVRRSFLPGQAREDIVERERLFGDLLSSVPGLRHVRFVDAGGLRLHFSTLAGDVLRRDGSSLAYRAYRDCPDVLPYANLESPEGGGPRLIFDGSGEQLIFSYPFTDSMEVYRGSALFTVSVHAVSERMIQEGRIRAGEDLSAVSSPSGFISGLPGAGNEGVKNLVASIWEEGVLSPGSLVRGDGEALALLSKKSAAGIFVGCLVQESLFTLPVEMKFLLAACFFTTVFLIVFLIFNIRQDSVIVVQNRLKRLQSTLIRQYYETKGDMDWKYWGRELEQRREEVRREIKRGLPRAAKKPAPQSKIDALFDRSWDELIAATGGRRPVEFDKEKLRALVTEVLRQTLASPSPGGEAPEGKPGAGASGETGAEELEELEGLEELEAVENAGAEPAQTESARREIMKNESADIEPLELEELDGEEEAELLEIPEGEDAREAGGEIVVTPEAFETEEPEAELEPLEDEAPAKPSLSPQDLAAIASQIEFGGAPETGDGEDEGGEPFELGIASPFDSLSFEAPGFSVGDGDTLPEAEGAEGKEDPGELKKKQEIETITEVEETGLEEITGDGGLPFIYQPFLFRGNEKPIPLRPLAEPGEPIREQDGIHLINSEILDPTLESDQNLDLKFARLVESVIGKGGAQPKGR